MAGKASVKPDFDVPGVQHATDDTRLTATCGPRPLALLFTGPSKSASAAFGRSLAESLLEEKVAFGGSGLTATEATVASTLRIAWRALSSTGGETEPRESVTPGASASGLASSRVSTSSPSDGLRHRDSASLSCMA